MKFYKVLQSFTKFYKVYEVLQSFTKLYNVYEVLQSFTTFMNFYIVLQSFRPKFYKVLGQSFTKFRSHFYEENFVQLCSEKLWFPSYFTDFLT